MCNFPLPPRGVLFAALEPLEEFFFITKKPAEAFVLSCLEITGFQDFFSSGISKLLLLLTSGNIRI